MAKSTNEGVARTDTIQLIAAYWKIKIAVTQGSSSAIKLRAINVISAAEIGSLGSGETPGSSTSGTNQTAPMRQILNNGDNFGPSGTVRITGFNFSTTANTLSSLSSVTLANCDILITSYNSSPSEAIAQRIFDWLEADKHRILMLAVDWKAPGVNYEGGTTSYNARIINTLWNQREIIPGWYNGATNAAIGDLGATRGSFYGGFNKVEKSAYFWRDGPFTNNYTFGDNCRFYVRDTYWGSVIAPSTNTSLIPLFYDNDSASPDNTRILLGVDPRRRIVYIGDSQLYYSSGSSNAQISPSTGVMTDANDYARLMANLWAWMVEEVVLAE